MPAASALRAHGTRPKRRAADSNIPITKTSPLLLTIERLRKPAAPTAGMAGTAKQPTATAANTARRADGNTGRLLIATSCVEQSRQANSLASGDSQSTNTAPFSNCQGKSQRLIVPRLSKAFGPTYEPTVSAVDGGGCSLLLVQPTQESGLQLRLGTGQPRRLAEEIDR